MKQAGLRAACLPTWVSSPGDNHLLQIIWRRHSVPASRPRKTPGTRQPVLANAPRRSVAVCASSRSPSATDTCDEPSRAGPSLLTSKRPSRAPETVMSIRRQPFSGNREIFPRPSPFPLWNYAGRTSSSNVRNSFNTGSSLCSISSIVPKKRACPSCRNTTRSASFFAKRMSCVTTMLVR